MRPRTWLIVCPSLAGLLACSGNNTGTQTDTDSTTADPAGTTAQVVTTTSDAIPTTTGDPGSTGDEDPTTALLVHSFGDYTLAPHQEVEPCAQWTLHNEHPVYVNTVTLANDGGFHHSNWLVVPESQFAGDDGYWDCKSRGFNELQAAVAGTVLFAQSTQSRYESQTLPTGVVIKIPPRHKLVAGVHLLNLSSAEHTSELRMGLEIIHPRDVETIAAPFRLNYQDLAIPPLSQSHFTGECMLAGPYEKTADVPLDIKLFHILPHYHYLGNYFSVEIIGGPKDGERIFEHGGFNGDGNGRTYNPPIDLTGAQGLRFTCGYDNWRDVTIGYGIGDQEMCTMLGLADMRIMMNASVDSNSQLVGTNDAGVKQFSGPCAVIGLPKNASQKMPSDAEREAPLYIPPQDDGDLDLDPVKPCVDTPSDAEPLTPVTLTSLRETVFTPSCSYSSCHGGNTPVAIRLNGPDLHDVLLGLSSTTPQPTPLVVPGDPDASWLYQLVSRCEPRDADGNLHTHMPFNAPTLLEPRLVAKMRDWIAAGAPDD